MPVYNFEAIDKTGKKVLDTVEADNLNAAISKIRELSYFPMHVHEKTAKQKKGKPSHLSDSLPFLSGALNISRVSQKQLTIFTRQLAVLSGSGVTVLKGLNILGEQQKPGFFRDIIESLSKDVESGCSLSDALSKYPSVFSSLYVNMVKSGEVGGVLEVVLSRLADFAEKNQRLSNRVRAALVYPIFVIVICFIVLTILVTFVVPKFMSIFAELGVNMPVPTLILLSASSILRRYWYMAPFAVFLLVFLYKRIMKSSRLRHRVDSLKLRLPIFGSLFRNIIIARFSRTFGTLTRSGVPILQALNISKDTTDNIVISDAIKRVHDSIREGDTVAGPLAKSGIFPAIVVNMINVGEETGQLDSMLLKVADTYEDEVEATVTGLTSVLEPVLIIIMGLVVGFIIISMLMPLISLIGSLSR